MKNNHLHIQTRQQSGAALITALVMLVMLTLLAISTLSTSTMEERMAANSQQINRLFQTADTGLAKLFDNPDALNTVAAFTVTNETVATGYTVDYDSEFRQSVPIGRTSNLAQMWEAGKYNKFYFDLGAESKFGTGSSQMTTTLEGGAFQISKAN